MKDELTNMTTSILARGKGFNEECYDVWEDGKSWRLSYYMGDGTGVIKNQEIKQGICTENAMCTNPTQSLLQRWLREKHNWHVEIFLDAYMNYCISFSKIGPFEALDRGVGVLCSTYEEALEIALFNILKRFIN